LLLSVLALLAMALFPVAAQAESAGSVYEPEVPTVPNETVPVHHTKVKNPAGSEKSEGAHAGSSSSPGGSGGGGGNGGHGQSGSNPSTEERGGTGTAGGGKAGANGANTPKVPNQAISPPTGAKDGGGSSSPLVPILIAIVVLAAITIGFVVYRQKRQRSAGQISPKAS
jgi:hypothetical protein